MLGHTRTHVTRRSKLLLQCRANTCYMPPRRLGICPLAVPCTSGLVYALQKSPALPLLSELSTCQTVKARFWSWLAGNSPSNMRCYLFEAVCVAVPRSPRSSSVRLNLGASFLVLRQDLRYKLNVHLLLIVFHDEPNFTRTELECKERVLH